MTIEWLKHRVEALDRKDYLTPDDWAEISWCLEALERS